MSVDLVRGHVLLPHRPDWSQKPRFRREWRTTLADAVTGAEARSSFRHLPLRGLEFQIMARTVEEGHQLAARIRAAKRSGMAAVPLWGRGSVLKSEASGLTVELASGSDWPWAVGDGVFFWDFEAYEVREVRTVAETTLMLDGALSGTYRGWCWPLILGAFKCGEMRVLSPHYSSVQVDVMERDERPEVIPDLCAILLVVEGGGDSFECYPEQDPVEQTLAAGNAWSGPWDGAVNFAGVQGEDRFEAYGEGQPSTLGGGTGWVAVAAVTLNLAGRVAGEDFEYADATALAGGSGWSAAGQVATGV